jgi:ATP-dependent protease HslVU (ClpYQ) peptidase subunit
MIDANMTCIIGLKHNGSIYMGGDSAGITDLSVQVRSDPKVFINKDFIFGFCGSFRMGQILQYSFVPPKHVSTKTDMSYLTTTFMNSVRSCFAKHGLTTTDLIPGSFLLGYRNNLYQVDCDFQVATLTVDYDSIGSGSSIALGSMYALADLNNPEERILRSLQAASYFSAGVLAPFTVLKLESKPKKKK